MARIEASRTGDQVASFQVITNQYGEQVEVNPFTGRDKDGNVVIAQSTAYTPPAKPASGTVFLPIATIVTQGGEEIDVDANGLAEDGSVPVGTTKTVPSGGAGGGGGGGNNNIGGGNLNPDRTKKKSAYDILFDDLNPLGLGSLVEAVLKPLIEDPGVSEEQFTTSLRKSSQYQTRFAANPKRIAAGLKPLDEATYLALEDKYQTVMRNYGLPESYYSKGAFGVQQGFENLIASDVSNTELEDRIMTAQSRVINANPEVTAALKQFYPDITNGDILAYSLNPKNAIKDIQRKVTAAEIGGAAMTPKDAAGKSILTTSEARARELAGYGVDKEAATAGYSTIGAGLQRGSELASIYGQSPYTQATAESEVFKLSGQTEARKQRQKVTGLEKATFGGQSGLTSGALARDRAGGY
jgi:hypothetical protein